MLFRSWMNSVRKRYSRPNRLHLLISETNWDCEDPCGAKKKLPISLPPDYAKQSQSTRKKQGKDLKIKVNEIRNLTNEVEI